MILPITSDQVSAFCAKTESPQIVFNAREPSASDVENRTHIQHLLDLATNCGCGTVVLQSGEYLIDQPLVLRYGASLLGQGIEKTTITNSRRDYDFHLSAVFLPGNFHPAYTEQFLEHQALDEVVTTQPGQRTITLPSPHSNTDVCRGDLIVVFSKSFYVSQTGNKVFEYLAIRKVISKEGKIIRLDRPLTKSVDGFLYNLRTGTIINAAIQAKVSNSGPLFAWGAGTVGRLAVRTNGWWISDSAALGGSFTDILVRASKGLHYGNCYQYCKFVNVSGTFSVSCTELSLNSEHTIVSSFWATYASDEKAGYQSYRQGISLQENCMFVTIAKGLIDISNAQNHPTIRLINAQNCTISEISASSRSLNFNGDVISLSSLDTKGSIDNSNNSLSIRWSGSCGHFVRIDGNVKSYSIVGAFYGATQGTKTLLSNGASLKHSVIQFLRT